MCVCVLRYIYIYIYIYIYRSGLNIYIVIHKAISFDFFSKGFLVCGGLLFFTSLFLLKLNGH